MYGKFKQLLLINAFLLLGSAAMAQGSVFYSDWIVLEESSRMLDVSYRVLKCPGANADQIYLNLFNENKDVTTTSFELEVTDVQSGNSKKYLISNYQIDFGSMHIPDCANNDYAELRLDLPTGFDPENITVEIYYH